LKLIQTIIEIVKARCSHKIGSPIGGIVPILKKIQDAGIPKIMRKCLGGRVNQAKYQYHDGLISWTLAAICGCKRIEQITKLKKKLEFIPFLKVPSHDTIGRIMKKLSTGIKISRAVTREREASFVYTYYNENLNLNRMLIKCTKAIGALKEGIHYSMDFDATYIECMRTGAIRTLDKNDDLNHAKIGFNPMIASVAGLPVFISMRNGNAAASFMILECLDNTLKLLEESNIKIGRVTADAAAFNKSVMSLLDNKGIKFNIRFSYQKRMIDFNQQLQSCSTWRKTEIETANYFWDCEVGDFSYTVSKKHYEHGAPKTYRVVTVRIPSHELLESTLSKEELDRRALINNKMGILKKKKALKDLMKPYEDMNWKKIGDYLYKFYITNDTERTSEEIIREYNIKRGTAERRFSFLKSDFSVSQMAFDKMEHNTVFLICAALAHNVFKGALELFKDKVPGLKSTHRLPEFIERFIRVACIYTGNTFVFFSQDILYDELMI
jgi:hypothetical protein